MGEQAAFDNLRFSAVGGQALRLGAASTGGTAIRKKRPLQIADRAASDDASDAASNRSKKRARTTKSSESGSGSGDSSSQKSGSDSSDDHTSESKSSSTTNSGDANKKPKSSGAAPVVEISSPAPEGKRKAENQITPDANKVARKDDASEGATSPAGPSTKADPTSMPATAPILAEPPKEKPSLTVFAFHKEKKSTGQQLQDAVRPHDITNPKSVVSRVEKMLQDADQDMLRDMGTADFLKVFKELVKNANTLVSLQ